MDIKTIGIIGGGVFLTAGMAASIILLLKSKKPQTNSSILKPLQDVKNITSKINPISDQKSLFQIEQPSMPDLPEFKDPKMVNVRYPLIPPYTFARISWDNENSELVYQIEEPVLNDNEKELLKTLEDGVKELINLSFISVKDKNTVLIYLEKNIRVLLTELAIDLPNDSFLKIMYYIYRDFVGMNQLEPLMNDYFIEDVECNGLNSPVYVVHRKYRNIRTNLIYKDIHEMAAFVEKMAQKCGRYVSYAEPLLDGSLPDGSIDYEEPVIYKQNGIVKVRKIGEVIDRYYGKNETNKPVYINDIEVAAFDKNYKINWKKADYVYRHKVNEELYQLDLEFGRKIKLTGCHSIFVLNNKGIISERTDNIKAGDYVILPSTIPENNVIKEINLAKELSTSKYKNKLVIRNVPIEIFKEKKQELYLYYNKNYKHPNQAYYEHKNKQIIPIELYNLLDETTLRNCFVGTTSTHHVPTFLKINEELMWFLGLYIAEGWLYNYDSYGVYFSLNKNENNLINEIKRCATKCFNMDIYVESEKDNSVKVKVDGLIFWLIMTEVLKVSKGAKSKVVPEIVFNVSKSLQKSFIKSWHAGDYSTTVSNYLANDISYLSLFDKNIAAFYKSKPKTTFIKGRKIKSEGAYYSNFYARDVENPYPSMIPVELFNPLNKTHWRLRNKRVSRERLIKILGEIRYKRFENLDLATKKFLIEWEKRGIINNKKLTDNGVKLLEEINLIKKLLKSDFSFAKINKISRVKSTSEYVYDFSVKDDENFVAGIGGICCHNSRLNATYTTDVSSKGPTFTVRRFSKTPWSPVQLAQKGTATLEIFAYIWMAVEYENSLMVIGGTGSGKTSFINAVAFFIPPQARVVSIEDTRELSLEHENWLPSVARSGVGLTNLVGQRYGEVSLFDLLKASFRQRPDYIIVGEVRGQEAFVLFQAFASIRGDEEIFVIKENKPLRIKIKDLENHDITKLKAISYNIKNKKCELLPINGWIRHPKRNTLYKITTRKGRETTITQDHSVFTSENNEIKEIKGENLVIGSKLIIPSYIECGYNNLSKINLLEYLPDLRIYAPELIKQASHKIGYYQASALIGCKSITDYYSETQISKPNSLKAEKFLKLMKETNIEYKPEELIVKYNGMSEKCDVNLEISDEFLRLLGYYISEGSLNQSGRNYRIEVYNKNEEVLKDMEKCIVKTANKIPKRKLTDSGWGEAIELSFNNKVLYEFIKRYCGTKLNKRIPDFIFGLDKRKIGMLLSSLYCGDGTVGDEVVYYTTSRKLAHDVSQLLLVYGIVATISKRNREGRKTTDYEIAFYANYKKEEFMKYIHPVGKSVKLRSFGVEDKNLLNDLYTDEIKSIEVLNLDAPEYVYDISVPGNENFIGGFGSILLHNSGHPGMATMHAENVSTMIKRLETNPINLSPSLIETLAAVIVMSQTRVKGKEVRKVSSIDEIVQIKEGVGGEIINTVFKWDPRTDVFTFNPNSKVFENIAVHYGMTKEQVMNEFRLRTNLLKELYKRGIVGFKEVQKVIQEYFKQPQEVLKRYKLV